MLERKKTKYTTPYDPSPYTVKETHGSQITATRDKVVRTRDAQQWKKVDIVGRKNYDRLREKTHTDRRGDDYFPDIGSPDKEHTGAAEGQEAPRGQEAIQGPAPTGPARTQTPAVKERWSFQEPQGWTTRARPLTRAVSARRAQDRDKLLRETRGTGSENREEEGQ